MQAMAPPPARRTASSATAAEVSSVYQNCGPMQTSFARHALCTHASHELRACLQSLHCRTYANLHANTTSLAPTMLGLQIGEFRSSQSIVCVK